MKKPYEDTKMDTLRGPNITDEEQPPYSDDKKLADHLYTNDETSEERMTKKTLSSLRVGESITAGPNSRSKEEQSFRKKLRAIIRKEKESGLSNKELKTKLEKVKSLDVFKGQKGAKDKTRKSVIRDILS